MAGIPEYAWMPFGHGARACIGRPFALQEAALVLAMMLRRFDMELTDPGYELAIQESLTIKPKNLTVRATPRHTPPRVRPPSPAADKQVMNRAPTHATPPDNARRFLTWLATDEPDLSGVDYLVLGCGSLESTPTRTSSGAGSAGTNRCGRSPPRSTASNRSRGLPDVRLGSSRDRLASGCLPSATL